MKLDQRQFDLELAAARQERGLNLAAGGRIIHFDPALHPRNPNGQFREILENMEIGQQVELPDGVLVKKKANPNGPGGGRSPHIFYVYRSKTSPGWMAGNDPKEVIKTVQHRSKQLKRKG